MFLSLLGIRMWNVNRYSVCQVVGTTLERGGGNVTLDSLLSIVYGDLVRCGE